ncbi:MAG TPA: Asd/ArgC dimerization domain-containing protein, partial [Polyangiaceae bacterium]
DLLGAFVYGLPELNREQIRGARCVASPGCFATAVELALLPLARGGFLRGPVEAVGVTGSSGSGAAPSLTAHHPTRANNLRTYRPLEHAQAPEMELALREAGGENFELSFVPVSAPLARGIFATCFVEVEETISDSTLRATFAQCYDSEPFVRVPAARLPEVVAVSGSNYAEVGFTVGTIHEGLRRVVVFSALDNLIRGGAGQAIQNLNLMLGMEESLTLDDPGPYP